MTIALLLLAAGNSTRMRGADKLLQVVDKQPCLRTMAMRSLAAGADLYVTLGPDHGKRRAVLAGLNLTLVNVPDAKNGLSHSLRAGISALPKTCEAAIILPADMPGITQTNIRTMMDFFTDQPETLIARATTQDGLQGHPILFSRHLFDLFNTLNGDRGAFHLVRDHAADVHLIPLQGQSARQDLDTPEDWAQWTAQQNRHSQTEKAER